MRFALAHPERTASLILMDTAARGVSLMPKAGVEGSVAFAKSAGMVAVAKAMREGARKNGSSTIAAQRTIKAMGFDVWWDRIQAKLESMDPEAFAELGVALFQQESLLTRLAEIRCPTSVIVGEQDEVFIEPADELERGIADAVRVTIPDSAHSPQLENPGPWLRAVSEHLTRARAGASTGE
jgi:pimeloyl-ACP methyl ester carboxylesterase